MTTQPEPEQPEGVEDETLASSDGAERVTQAIADQFGEQAARTFSELWRSFDEWAQDRHANEGLRERKKRLTRQRISDIATAMFIRRGFDEVRISEIAELAGVSEKTIYNYFPTKESLVYDQADEQLERLLDAVRNRAESITPSAAFLAELKLEAARFSSAFAERVDFLANFADMVSSTPALRAAWGEYRHRMVDALTALLAQEFDVDPRDPEPITAARGLVSLLELYYDSQLRHITDGIRNPELLREAIEADLDRGARLLETGFWSMQLLMQGRRTKTQLRDAATAAEQARQQVMSAMRDAKRAWEEVKQTAKLAAREQAHQAAAEAKRAALEQAQQAAKDARVRAVGRGRNVAERPGRHRRSDGRG